MKKTLMTAALATLVGTTAFAQSATDQIINDLTGQGFQRIEIDNGLSQIKVEAIRGTQKLEVVYDRATGDILKQEVERVRAGEDIRPGIEIRERDRNFVDAGRPATESRGATVTRASLGDTDQIVRDLQAQGFTRIEVKTGLTQTKVEAIRGTEKVETVYDSASGAIIKQEVERVESDDDTRPGIEIATRNRDFVDDSRPEDDDDRRDGPDDDDDDRRGGRDDDDDEDDDDRRGGRDDDDDEDDDDRRGGRDNDDGDDDRGRDHDEDRDHDRDHDDNDHDDDDEEDDSDDEDDDDDDDDDEDDD